MSRTTISLCATILAAAASTSTSARAESVYLVGGDTTLYRITGTSSSGYVVEDFDLGIELHGMHYNADTDTVLVLSDSTGSTSHATIYTLANATQGTPSLSVYSTLSNRYGGFTRAGSDYFGFDRGDMWRIDLSDPSNPGEEYIGNTGVLYTAGSAYDSVTSTLYMLSAATDGLYSVDRATAVVTWLGGFGIDAVDIGAEWFNGRLYAAMQNNNVEELQLGQVDTQTGLYSPMLTLTSPAMGLATSLAIIPEPGTVAIVAVLLLVLRRR